MTAEEASRILHPYLGSLVSELVESYYIPPRRIVLFNHPFRMIAPRAIGVPEWYIPPYRRVSPPNLASDFWESPIGQALSTLAQAHNISLSQVENALLDAIDDEQTLRQLLERLRIAL